MTFKQAVKKNCKGRIAIIGPAGSGKTYTALQMAEALGAQKIAVIDTERGSASKYANKFNFSVVEPADSDPRKYLALINEAAANNFDCLILDSFSHLWNGKNGVLEKVDQAGGNKFSNGWKTYNPLVNTIVDTILSYPGHVIATMRNKTAYVVEQVDGKAVPRKVGLEPIQRDGMDYEFDMVLRLADNQELYIQKQRDMNDLEGFHGNRKDLPMIYMTLKGFLNV